VKKRKILTVPNGPVSQPFIDRSIRQQMDGWYLVTWLTQSKCR